VIVLVAVFILDVENVLVVVRPTVARDGADLLVGDGLRFGDVVDRRDPDVHDVVHGSLEADPLAVVAEPGLGALRISEENIARN
jgi:hypothetical protein